MDKRIESGCWGSVLRNEDGTIERSGFWSDPLTPADQYLATIAEALLAGNNKALRVEIFDQSSPDGSRLNVLFGIYTSENESPETAGLLTHECDRLNVLAACSM